MIKVKVCCISSIIEANTAVEAGANIIGLVGPMPSGPGIISNKKIEIIAKSLPSHIDSWLLTSETSASNIIKHHSLVKTNSIQIVDRLKEGSYSELKKALPGVKIIQVLHVIDETTIEQALRVSDQVDCILLDSGNPNKKLKKLGGTGKVHNWEISKQIVESVNVPVFLAGGLNAKNVSSAIQKVNPYGIDLCSGVRTNMQLDKMKLREFMQQVKDS